MRNVVAVVNVREETIRDSARKIERVTSIRVTPVDQFQVSRDHGRKGAATKLT